MPTSASTSHIPACPPVTGARPAGWKFWSWRPAGQGVALSNARGASIALAELRVEREDVDDFLAHHEELCMDIQFVENQGTYTGSGPSGRVWSISRVFTGWRLEFRDGADMTATYAGVHRSLAAAQAEAAR